MEPYKIEVIEGVEYSQDCPHVNHGIICQNMYCIVRNQIDSRSTKAVILGPGYFYSDVDRESYVIPDFTIICDRNNIRDGYYYGIPTFIAEVETEESSDRDRGIKKKIYATKGVPEYWIINYEKKKVEIYYLAPEERKYVLANSYEYTLENEDTEITLCKLPVKVRLKELFEEMFED